MMALRLSIDGDVGQIYRMHQNNLQLQIFLFIFFFAIIADIAIHIFAPFSHFFKKNWFISN